MGNNRGVSREELKHGAVVAMAVLLVLGLLAAWSVLIPGVMAWDDIVAAVIGSLTLTGPVSAVFAAWVAVCGRRAYRGRTPTTWGALRGPLAILLVVVTAFAATVLVLTLRVVVGDQAGRLTPGGLAVGAAGLALYVTMGWVLGWLIPAGVTPPLAGIGTFGLFTWLAGSSTWEDRLAPATRKPYDLFQGLSAVACTDQTLWLVGVSATLLLGWAAIVTRQALTLAAAVLALMLAGTGLARLLTEPATVTANERMAYSCQEWPITVCVRPGMRSGLSELGSAFTTVAGRLVGTPAAFKRAEQRSRGDAEWAAAGHGVVPIHVDDLDAGYAERATSEFVERLAEPCTDASAAGYRAIVVAWLTGEPLPAGPLPEHRQAAEWFSALTEKDRRDWLRMFYTDFTTCRLRSRHFGNGTQQIDPDRSTYPVDPTPGHPTTSAAPSVPSASPAPSASPSLAVLHSSALHPQRPRTDRPTARR